MSVPTIKFENVTKIFKTKRQIITAVKDFSMELSKGEFVSVLGPSGCGKSTLIRMLCDITKPTSGTIEIDGVAIDPHKKIPVETLKKIGFIFQQPNLLPWCTLRENIELPLKIFKLKGKEWEERVDYLIAMTGLTEYANAYPVEISGGMTQRAGVARAMVHDPEILLMDEPFGALDEFLREQLDMELLSIWEKTGKTIIFITHSVDEAILVSSRIYVMATQPGRLIETVEIDLPRPRSLDMIVSPEFVDYGILLKDLIGKLDLSKIK